MKILPDRLWVITGLTDEYRPVIFGAYVNGKEAEEGLKRLRSVWPKEDFVLSSFAREASR